jgi:hypothetical protein
MAGSCSDSVFAFEGSDPAVVVAAVGVGDVVGDRALDGVPVTVVGVVEDELLDRAEVGSRSGLDSWRRSGSARARSCSLARTRGCRGSSWPRGCPGPSRSSGASGNRAGSCAMTRALRCLARRARMRLIETIRDRGDYGLSTSGRDRHRRTTYCLRNTSRRRDYASALASEDAK